MGSAERTSKIVTGLCRWFRREARDLPWRRRRNGYTALVAESMLQQTQVARVVDYYRAFMRQFPGVRRLAEAREQDVLAVWQGMGYYRRARHLHAAAKMIVRDYRGRMPRAAKELQKLPGVGRYSAASIASIVYGERVPAVDGNVERVLARLEANNGQAWERAGELVVVAREPGVLNEALMELGAVVCTPKQPRCESCPVATHCRALRLGRPEAFPAPKQAVVRKAVHHYAVVVRRNGKILLERRPANGMWSRMWQVPTVETGRALRVAELKDALAGAVADLKKLAEFEHTTTHRRITFQVFTARSRTGNGVWRRVDDTRDLPMSNAQRRVLALLTDG